MWNEYCPSGELQVGQAKVSYEIPSFPIPRENDNKLSGIVTDMWVHIAKGGR